MTETQLTQRYRPAALDDLVGQDHVRTVLGSMADKARAGNGAPATLLFSGPRGTGKTSTARMFAAALNSTTGYDASEGSTVEVDAASNGGVDDVRQLTDTVVYAPVGRHRTYILDECHALSPAAWQALLKALEEPPSHVTFILVTTEVEKVPDTIVSRALHLRFAPVTLAHIVARLDHIAGAEAIFCEDGVLEAIAEHAEGGMRDAIMALEQTRMATTGDQAGCATLAGFQSVYGAVNFAPQLLAVLATGDVAKALEVVGDYARHAGTPMRLIDDAVTELAGRISAGAPPQRLVRAIKALWAVRADMVRSPMGTQAAMAVIFAELADAFVDLPHAPAPVPTIEQPLGLAAIASMLGQPQGANPHG